jgi:uncharacterized protein YggE
MIMEKNSNTMLLVIGVLIVVLLTAGLTYYISKSGTNVPPTNGTDGGTNPSITVRGEATRTLSPDLMTLGFSLESVGSDSASSQAKSAADTAALKAALLAAGVNEGEIETSSYYTNPVYNESCYSDCPYYGYEGYGSGYSSGGAAYGASSDGAMMEKAYMDIAPMPPYPCKREGECNVIGYKTTHSILVKSGKTTEGGKYIEAALGATNATRVDYVYFSVKEETRVAVDSALQAEAASAAKAKAQNIAAGLGARLGKIISINPDYYYPYYPVYAYDNRGGTAVSSPAPTEIFPTDTQMSSSITVVYGLEQ